MPSPRIDSTKCNHCGTCAEICPMGVFERTDHKTFVKEKNECIGCRACEAHCGQGALHVEE